MNNRILLYIFLAVVLIFVTTKLLRKDRSGSFDPVVSAIDTNRVDRIQFISGGVEKEEFELHKKDSIWQAVKGEAKVDVAAGDVRNVLAQLADLRADRIVTKDPAMYAGYEITDTLAARVIAYQGKKVLAGLWLGGFRFDQATRSASAFVKKDNGPAVYEVNGFAIMGLKQGFDQYRDKTVIRMEPADLMKIEWSDASGRKEVIVKEDGAWYYAGMEAIDSAAFDEYVVYLSRASWNEFSKVSSVEGRAPAEKLTLYGNNMAAPVVVTAYHTDFNTGQFLIHSSLNREALFLTDSAGLYDRIFGELKKFWP